MADADKGPQVHIPVPASLQDALQNQVEEINRLKDDLKHAHSELKRMDGEERAGKERYIEESHRRLQQLEEELSQRRRTRKDREAAEEQAYDDLRFIERREAMARRIRGEESEAIHTLTRTEAHRDNELWDRWKGGLHGMALDEDRKRDEGRALLHENALEENALFDARRGLTGSLASEALGMGRSAGALVSGLATGRGGGIGALAGLAAGAERAGGALASAAGENELMATAGGWLAGAGKQALGALTKYGGPASLAYGALRLGQERFEAQREEAEARGGLADTSTIIAQQAALGLGGWSAQNAGAFLGEAERMGKRAKAAYEKTSFGMDTGGGDFFDPMNPMDTGGGIIPAHLFQRLIYGDAPANKAQWEMTQKVIENKLRASKMGQQMLGEMEAPLDVGGQLWVQKEIDKKLYGTTNPMQTYTGDTLGAMLGVFGLAGAGLRRGSYAIGELFGMVDTEEELKLKLEQQFKGQRNVSVEAGRAAELEWWGRKSPNAATNVVNRKELDLAMASTQQHEIERVGQWNPY